MDNENNLEWLQPQLFNRFKKNLQHGQLAHAYLLRAYQVLVRRKWLFGCRKLFFA